MLDVLPSELVLATLSYTPLQTVAVLCRVSPAWQAFITSNESSIYRNAAYFHNFITHNDAAFDNVLDELHGKLWNGVQSWKELCRRRFQLEKNWMGRGRSVLRNFSTGRDDIHRIKVDERHQFLITTHMKGGLRVSNLFPTYTIWSLSTDYVRAHAHCDYDNGFLVFDRLGHAKEIWRLVCDAGEGETASHAPPDDKQTKYHEQSYARHPVTVDNRGHFRPWALISYPEKTLAFRFVYPTLLTSGEHHIYLHDVRTGEQIRVLENAVLDSSPAWNMVTYLELSERHVFIATEDWVRVFSRADGSQLLTLRKSAQDSYHHITVEPKKFPSRLSSDAVLVPQVLKHGRDNEVGNEFVAVHVSEDGRDMVILREADVTFLQDWERICRGEVSVSDIAVVFTHQHAEFIYVAFNHGRIAIAHADGLCIFTTDASHHGLSTDDDHDESSSPSPKRSFPRLSLCIAQPLESHPFLSSLSCIQMTMNRVYFTWDARGLPPGVQLYEDPEAVVAAPHGPVRLSTEVATRITYDAMIASFPDHYWPSVGCIDLAIMPEI